MYSPAWYPFVYVSILDMQLRRVAQRLAAEQKQQQQLTAQQLAYLFLSEPRSDR